MPVVTPDLRWYVNSDEIDTQNSIRRRHSVTLPLEYQDVTPGLCLTPSTLPNLWLPCVYDNKSLCSRFAMCANAKIFSPKSVSSYNDKTIPFFASSLNINADSFLPLGSTFLSISPKLSTLNPRAKSFLLNVPCITPKLDFGHFYPPTVGLNPNAEPFISKTSPSRGVEKENSITLLQSTESFRISTDSLPYNINQDVSILDNRLSAGAPIFRPNRYRPIPCRIDVFRKTVKSHKSTQIGENINDILNESSDSSGIDTLKDIRTKNQDRVIIGHLNVNSIRNKIEFLSNLVQGNIDIFLVSETKIDDSFTTSQFLIPGFSPPFPFGSR